MAADGKLDQPAPSEQQMHQFLLHLREVILLCRQHRSECSRIRRPVAGRLGTCGSNVPSRRPQIVDHFATAGGRGGFFSVSGISLRLPEP